jgi:hypothetical protein
MDSIEEFFKLELEIAHLRGGIDQISVVKKIINDLNDEMFMKSYLLGIINNYEKLCQSKLDEKINSRKRI